MNVFEFYQDQYMKIWNRTHFSIMASSYELALEELKEYEDKNINDCEDKILTVISNELIYNTMEKISREDNNGKSTLKILEKESENVILDNAVKKSEGYEIICSHTVYWWLAEKDLKLTSDEICDIQMAICRNRREGQLCFFIDEDKIIYGWWSICHNKAM